jgi:hypothetical protein
VGYVERGKWGRAKWERAKWGWAKLERSVWQVINEGPPDDMKWVDIKVWTLSHHTLARHNTHSRCPKWDSRCPKWDSRCPKWDSRCPKWDPRRRCDRSIPARSGRQVTTVDQIVKDNALAAVREYS